MYHSVYLPHGNVQQIQCDQIRGDLLIFGQFLSLFIDILLAQIIGQFLEKIQSHPLVDQMEPEAKVRVGFSAPNDPLFSKQYYFDQIGAGAACDKGNAQGKPLVVAVVDSGVEASHPDLQEAFFRNSKNEVVGANFVSKGSAQAPDGNWNDEQGHGTHVAGIIAATGQNRQGIMGVAACQGVKIMPVRVLNGQGEGGALEVERGVKWAADNGAHIINLSLGFTATTRTEQAKINNSLYTQLQRRGIWVVAAAGNESLLNGSFGPADPNFPSGKKAFRYSLPASYEGVISVAATNQNNQLAPFSNYGKFVDVAAPGYQILSTYLGGTYRSLNGTSMASPVFAGSLALAIMQLRFGEGPTDADFPLLDSADWPQMFQKASSSAPLDSSKVLAGGVLNADRLVQEVLRLTSSPSPNLSDVVPLPSPDVALPPSPDVAPAPTPDVALPPTPAPNVVPSPAAVPSPNAVPSPAAVSQPFQFDDIAANGEWKGPKEFKVANLPGETKVVLFQFNGRTVEWILVGPSQAKAQTVSRYVVRNQGILEAFALNSQRKILGKISIRLSP